MKHGALWTVVALSLCAGAAALAGNMKMGEMKTTPSFDQLKTLVGDWEAQTPDGKTVKASYQIVSSGTCVMETLNTPDGMNMVTVYHIDGGKLVMDHYCAMNNVPHMKASAASDTKAIDFAFVSAGNMASAKDTHMHGLKVAFEDGDHFSEEWSMHSEGKVQPVVFHFARAK